MKKILTMVVLIGVSIIAYSEPITITSTQKFSSVADGIVNINGVDKGIISVGAKLNFDKPVKIKMKMRRLGVSEVKPGHFGVELYGGDKFRAHFYSHDGAHFIAALHQGKKTFNSTSTKGNLKKIFPANKDAQWVDVELYVQPKLTEIHIDGKPQGIVRGNLLPLRKLSLYGYHNDIEVKDIESSLLAEMEKISTDPNPSFQASFDEDLDAVTAQGKLAPSQAFKIKSVPGLVGKAVKVTSKNKIKSPITAHNSWKTVNGTLELRNDKSRGPFSVALPELTDATISLKFKRLMVPKSDQHCGISLSGGDFGISFYTRGPELLYNLTVNKKSLVHKGLGKINLLPGGEDSPWNQFELKLSKGKIEALVNGKSVGTVKHAFSPITKVSYYNYTLDTAIDDLEIKSDKFNLKEDFTDFINPRTPPMLEYDTKGLFANHGTISFWTKSDWDGHFTGNIPVYPMCAGFDSKGKQKLSVDMYFWISFNLGRTGDLRGEQMQRKSRGSWYQGDWHHIAMVWSDGGWNKAFLDGLPYQQPFGYNGQIFNNLDLKDIVRFTLGTGSRRAGEATFDDLKIYKRPLSNGEIYDEYRSFMPVDLLLDRTVIDAEKADNLVLLAAPGGYYMRPMPADRPFTTGNVNIKMQLADKDDKVVAEKEFSLKMTKATELKMPVENLSAGKYRLKCAVSYGRSTFGRFIDVFRNPEPVATIQRSFDILAYKPLAAVEPSNDEIELGKVIFSWDAKGTNILNAGGVKLIKSSIGNYLEAGEHKEHRFSFEVPFAGKYLDGQPVMVEVTWPDDKPRSMGLYLYPESKRAFHRDRMGGGIQSGVEYPLTGNMQKTQYLFYPGLTNYLFEARTMVNKFSAAVAGVRIYEIKNRRLPKLEINYPENLPPRQFGYLDEDETSDQNLGWDYKNRNMQNVTERLLDYLDYTGQNTWQYPFMRYTGYNFPMEGVLHGLYPYRASYRYMVEAFSRRGKITIPNINLFTLPEMKMLPDETEECIKKGWPLTKYNDPPVQPNKYTKPNHANPDIRAMVCRHVRATAQRYGNLPGVDGINFTTGNIGFYPSLDYGYDDYTVTLFSKETGVNVIVKTPEERKEFLTKEPQLAKWLKWRNEHSFKLFSQMRAEIDKVNPKLKLYLGVSMTAGSAAHESSAAAPMALFKKLQAIKGVYLVPTSNVTSHRWLMHFGRPADGCNDLIFDPKQTAHFMNGKLGFVDGYHNYFESFCKSLKNDKYASYFQNADVKPFGRYFLKELAYAVSGMDAQRILIGAQPLGTWGRDVESREFAKAYCALPALPFENAPGAQDPVTVRYLNTDKGSYLYAVSMLWSDCESTLTISSKVPITDLSTGKKITNGQIKLKAFELRSFYSTDPNLKITEVKTVVTEDVLKYYHGKLDRLQKAIAILTAEKIDCGDAKTTLKIMQKLMKDVQFAELHRLLFSLSISDVMNKADNFANFAKQAEMIRRGNYAVNCGTTTFYKAKNGTLFFPDQAFKKGNYGYSGAYLSVTRNTDGIKTPDAELFMTEAYAIDNYKFKVPNGKYKVRLYLKAAYKKGFKPGCFVFSVDVQGKRVLDNLDLVTYCENDFGQVIIKDFNNIEAKNGLLEIKFINDKEYDPSVKLVNAIEIIPEKE